MNILVSLLGAIAAQLLPILIKEVVKQGEILIPKLVQAVADEVDTAAIASFVVSAASKSVDKATDLTPFEFDDKLLDPLVEKVGNIFRNLGKH